MNETPNWFSNQITLNYPKGRGQHFTKQEDAYILDQIRFRRMLGETRKKTCADLKISIPTYKEKVRKLNRIFENELTQEGNERLQKFSDSLTFKLDKINQKIANTKNVGMGNLYKAVIAEATLIRSFQSLGLLPQKELKVKAEVDVDIEMTLFDAAFKAVNNANTKRVFFPLPDGFEFTK